MTNKMQWRRRVCRAGFAGAALRAIRTMLLMACLASASASHAAKDTPFGTELVAAGFPNSTSQDFFTALTLSAALGSHSCFTWNWGDASSPRSMVVSLPPLIQQFGMKSVIQIGATFLGNPAPPDGFVKSFADPQVRQRYLDDVTAIANSHPDYIVLTTEANLMYRFNRAEFENYRTLYAEAYNAVKRISPKTSVGVSYLYSLWFLDYIINHIDVPALIAPADFVAFTSYPEWLVREGHYPDIASIPTDFHGYARLAYPKARIVFSEVGWASKGRGTPALQAEFMRNLPRLMSTTQPELVTWALLYDVEFFTRNLLTPDATKFLVDLNVDIDSLFEHFNGMGLLSGTGVAKPALQDAVNLKFVVP
ncbi:hypothetical protein BH11PSE9_BH11PSE9_20410 [soil metagenome]